MKSKDKRILITGASGLVGTALTQHLSQLGYEIVCLSTKKNYKSSFENYYWNPLENVIEDQALEDIDIVINLAGDNISSGRWTTKKKASIIQSRLNSLRTLHHALLRTKLKPELWINASAIGIYQANQTKPIHDDNCNYGNDFLANTVMEWEAHTTTLLQEKVGRLCLLRIGLVMSKDGGFFEKMLQFSNLGMTNYFCSGNQIYSWIHITDLCNIITFIIDQNQLSGPINATSPVPSKLMDISLTLHQLNPRSKVHIGIPAIVLKIILGQMAAIILDGNAVIPSKLINNGYKYKYIYLESAIREILSSQKI